MQNSILIPIKVNPSTKKSIDTNLSKHNNFIKQHSVRRSVLRQFDPLLEKFDEKQEKRNIMMESDFHEKEVPKEKYNLSSPKKQANVSKGGPDIPINLEKGSVRPPTSMEEWCRLSTIDETSTEDLTNNYSVLHNSGTLIKAYANVLPSKTQVLDIYSADLIGKIPPDLYGRSSEKTVETSSCSSCSSYTTTCSTLDDLLNTLPTLPPYHQEPLQAQQYLHQELTLENELCIEHLKEVHERNKAIKAVRETYEKHLEEKAVEFANAQLSHDELKVLLDVGEHAFSELHSKYNKAKEIIEGFNKNEREIEKITAEYDEVSKHSKEKYRILEEHGRIKIMEFRQIAAEEPKIFEKELKMMQAALKHLQIKTSSLEQQLVQKTKEYDELSNLYHEIVD